MESGVGRCGKAQKELYGNDDQGDDGGAVTRLFTPRRVGAATACLVLWLNSRAKEGYACREGSMSMTWQDPVCAELLRRLLTEEQKKGKHPRDPGSFGFAQDLGSRLRRLLNASTSTPRPS